jgi:RNase P protein component
LYLGYDYLLIAKPETLTADFKQIQRDLRELLHAQGLHRDDTAKNTQTNRAKQKNSSKSASKKSSQTHRTHSPSSKS